MSAHSDIHDWGDYADSDDEYDVEEASENPQRYAEGLYYPICIGETLANQYRVEHKLGHGGFLTVWMAYDTLGKKNVALKIMTPEGPDEHDYKMQIEIARNMQDTSYLLLYESTFLLSGPLGNHRVLVLPL